MTLPLPKGLAGELVLFIRHAAFPHREKEWVGEDVLVTPEDFLKVSDRIPTFEGEVSLSKTPNSPVAFLKQ